MLPTNLLMSSNLPVHVLFVGGKGTVIVIEAQAPEGDAIASAEVMGNVKYSALSSTSYIYSFDKRMKPTKAQLNVARSTTEDLQRTSPCCNIV